VMTRPCDELTGSHYLVAQQFSGRELLGINGMDVLKAGCPRCSDRVFSVLVKRLAGKSISEMSCFASS